MKCSPAVGAAAEPASGRTRSGTARYPGDGPRECTAAAAAHRQAGGPWSRRGAAHRRGARAARRGRAAHPLGAAASDGQALPLVTAEALQEEHLATRALDPDSRGHDTRVVDDGERLRRGLAGKVAEATMPDLAGRPREDEQPRLVPPRGRLLRDQLRRQLVFKRSVAFIRRRRYRRL